MIRRFPLTQIHIDCRLIAASILAAALLLTSPGTRADLGDDWKVGQAAEFYNGLINGKRNVAPPSLACRSFSANTSKWRVCSSSDANHKDLYMDENKPLVCGQPFSCTDFKWADNRIQCFAAGGPKPMQASLLQSCQRNPEFRENAMVDFDNIKSSMKVDLCQLAKRKVGEPSGRIFDRERTAKLNGNINIVVYGGEGKTPICSLWKFTAADKCTQIFASSEGIECLRYGQLAEKNAVFKYPKYMPNAPTDEDIASFAKQLYNGKSSASFCQITSPTNCETPDYIRFGDPTALLNAVVSRSPSATSNVAKSKTAQ